jgi:FixJ family two-component response regulator/PAS domain-containing protein
MTFDQTASDPGAAPPLPDLRERATAGRHVDALGPASSWPASLRYALEMIDLSSSPMVIAWGADRLMFHNAAFVPVLRGKTDVEGRPLHEVFAESWEAIGELFARAESGESVSVEDWAAPVTRNGRLEPGWWNISYSRLPTVSGEAGGVLCIVQETTRAHLAEARTRAAQAELALVTDVVPSLLWRADRFGRTQWRNARLRTLRGEAGDDDGDLWTTLLHPDDMDGVTAELRQAKLGRRSLEKAMRLKMTTGEYRWHLARLEPTFDEARALTGWCGVATDIHASVDAVEALDRRTALFAQFAENTASLIWTLDLQTLTIERLTPNFSRIWPDLAPDRPWRWDQFLTTIHAADRPTLEAGLERSAAGEVGGGKFRVVMPDGAIRMVDCSIFPIMTPDGRIPCIGGSLQILTRERPRVAHLVDADPGSQNRLSHGLRKRGFEVTVFDSLEGLADVAAGMAPGPLLYHHQGDEEALARLSGLMRNSGLSRDPWIVLQPGERPAREAVAIMKLGACDILEIDAPIDAVVVALDTAASLIRPTEPLDPAPRAPRYRLTGREFEIAQGLVAGGTNKTIGQGLGISPRTVESHRGRLMERLGVKNLAELVALVTSPAFDVDIRS